MVAFTAYAYMLLYLVGLPWAAWRTKQALAQPQAIFEGTRWMRALIAQQVVLLLFSLLVAWVCYVPVWPQPLAPASAWWWGAALLLLALCLLRVRWAVSTPERRARLQVMLPTTPERRLPWVLLSLGAGLGEELAFRWVLPMLLMWWLDLSPLWAAIVSAASFGACHAPQGVINALITAGYGLACSWVVLQSGNSLLIVVLVHAIYDIAAGFLMARWVTRAATQAHNA